MRISRSTVHRPVAGDRTLPLVALPSIVPAFVALRGRQPAESECVVDTPDARRADLDGVIAVQVHRDLLRSEWYCCPGPADLLDGLRIGLRRSVGWHVRPVPQSLVVEPAVPRVAAPRTDAVVAAGGGDVPAHFSDVTQHRTLVLGAVRALMMMRSSSKSEGCQPSPAVSELALWQTGPSHPQCG